MSGSSDERLVLAGGSVFDVEAGVSQQADIALVGDRICDVETDLDGETTIDCSGLTLLPGLIDCHAHMTFHGLSDPSAIPPSFRLLEAVPDLRRTIQLGVTTVRHGLGVQVNSSRGHQDQGSGDSLVSCHDGVPPS